ncbi:LCP family protein [Paenibacillus sp. GCM10027626]|uniref:LCP family protein n=1 Tax=Paenibacillus sp. GCM10027626 TaxID=3273411 RepID=UPI0036379E28
MKKQLKGTDENAEIPSRMKKKKPKKISKLSKFMLILLVLLIGIAGYLGVLFTKSKDALRLATSDADPGLVIPADQSVKVKPVAVLLLGLDSRPELASLNTDVIMVAAMNPKTKKATIVTMPRDSKIELSGYKSKKVNAYYAAFRSNAMNEQKLSKEEAEKVAKLEMRKMLSRYFDIDISYTAVINFNGFVDVVDALGGVEVDVDMDMKYIDNADKTNIDLKKGHHKLDGKDALGFVRYRKSNDGKNMSTDFDRNRRQGQVIGAVVGKMKSFDGITSMSGVIDALGKNMKMDMPESEAQNIILTYFNMDRSNVEFVPLEGDWKSPYVYVTSNSLKKAQSALKAQLSE